MGQPGSEGGATRESEGGALFPLSCRMGRGRGPGRREEPTSAAGRSTDALLEAGKQSRWKGEMGSLDQEKRLLPHLSLVFSFSNWFLMHENISNLVSLFSGKTVGFGIRKTGFKS